MGLYRRAVRRAFHHFYRELAWTYDAVASLVSGGLWFQWGRAALPELRGRALEIGFGTGHIQLALAGRPATFGLDASPQMARIAAARLRRHSHVPRLARGVAQQLPFPAATFDSVLATFPAEYIVDPATHAELRRVLAPGGRLVIVPLAQLDPGLFARLVDLAYSATLQTPTQSAKRSSAERKAPRSAGAPVDANADPGATQSAQLNSAGHSSVERSATAPAEALAGTDAEPADALAEEQHARLRIAGIPLERRWVRVGRSRALILTGVRDDADG